MAQLRTSFPNFRSPDHATRKTGRRKEAQEGYEEKDRRLKEEEGEAVSDSEYPRCKDCRWWGVDPISGDAARRNNAALCFNEFVGRISWQDESRGLLAEVDDAPQGVLSAICPSNAALIEGDGREDVSLWTGPDFGCVHWEAGPDQPG